MGARVAPRDINAAIRTFVARRAAFDVAVPRELEAEVRRGIARLGLAEQHAPQHAMGDAGEIARFYDRCSDLMRELLDALALTPDQPRTFPDIEDAMGWPRRRIASVLGGVSRIRNLEFGGRRPYRFLDERDSASGRWEMWMDAVQAAAVRVAGANAAEQREHLAPIQPPADATSRVEMTRNRVRHSPRSRRQVRPVDDEADPPPSSTISTSPPG